MSQKVERDRVEVPVIVMDLSRPTETIHADLCARYPRVVDLWWELDEGEQTGLVWDHGCVLAKLQHALIGITAVPTQAARDYLEGKR